MSNRKVYLPETGKWVEVTDEAEETFASIDKALENKKEDKMESKSISVVTDTDITSELPQLKGSGWKVMGTSERGSLTTLIDSELSDYEDGYFTGGNLYSIDKDELRDVTGFDQESGAIVTEPFSCKISTDKYILTRSFSEQINKTLEILEGKLENTDLVIDPYDYKEIHTYMAVAEVCKGLSVDDIGFWWKMWKEYDTRATELFNSRDFQEEQPEPKTQAHTEVLKPCPFCGGVAEIFSTRNIEGYYIECYSEYNDYDCCEVKTPYYKSEVEATQAWNKRNSHQELVEALRETKKKLNHLSTIVADNSERETMQDIAFITLEIEQALKNTEEGE